MTSDEHSELTENRDTDAILQLIVGMVNTFESGGFAITLTVGGSFITGQLIGTKEYLERFADLWPQSARGKLGESLKTQFQAAASDASKKAKQEFEEVVGKNVRFVHLRDAQLITPAGLVPTNDGVLWRCRVSEVQAFSWGKLMADPR
jgi:hypothetical protein